MSKTVPAIPEIAGSFSISGTCIAAEPYGGGHINDTYKITCELPSGQHNLYLLQRINTEVFSEPDKLMSNISHITNWIKQQTGKSDSTLTIIPHSGGNLYYRCKDESCWRMYSFIKNTSCCIKNLTTIEAAGTAFGSFLKSLADFDASSLYDIIPGFHDTETRLKRLESSIQNDIYHRVQNAEKEISFILERKDAAHMLTDMRNSGILPIRVTHNDTKLDNILFDTVTEKPVCIVDLDTVMPGLSLWDFGDSIRSSACLCDEDEQDISNVKFLKDYFEAYTRGYLRESGDVLTEEEKTYLPQGARIITLEQAIRFLDDYLNNDTYYKTDRPNQNLDRCRVQIELVRQMESMMPELNKTLSKYM